MPPSLRGLVLERLHQVFGRTFSIFGNDERHAVADVGISPYSAICALHVTGWRAGQEEKSVGTGFLIGPRLLLTAGHVLDDIDFQFETASAIPQCAATTEPFGSLHFNPVDVQYYDGWAGNHAPEYDLALVRLPSGGPDALLMPFVASDADLAGKSIEIAGYPTCFGTQCPQVNRLPAAYRGRRMYAHRNPVAQLSAAHIYSRVDTWEGQSGSPVIAPHLEPGIVVGVHTRGLATDDDDAPSKTHNSAVRFTPPMLTWIEQFR